MAKTDWVFGIHAVSALLARSPEKITEIHLQKGREDGKIQELCEQAARFGISCTRVEKKQLLAWAQGGNHQGVVAKVRPAQARDEGFLKALLERRSDPVLLLVLDSVTDPHNLGACLRTAEAVGVDAVIAPKDKASGLTPVVRKVSVGAAELIPFVQVTNLARTLEMLQRMGVWVLGTALDEASSSLYKADLRGNLALVMGAEGTGMRRLTQQQCDGLIHIPMAGQIQSLNVSVAAGVCLFEAYRQRMQPVDQ